MKKLLLILLIPLFMSCDNKYDRVDSYINQKVKGNCWDLCNGGCDECFQTTVWYKGDIYKVWYDDLNTITDSIVCLRKKEANDYLLKLIKLDKGKVDCD